MLIVTGGIACGKSTFTGIATSLGLSVKDADDWFKKEFKVSGKFVGVADKLFDTQNLFTVAFKHPNWRLFEELCCKDFNNYICKKDYDIVVIPEYFKNKHLFTFSAKVLTIEREEQVSSVFKRDCVRQKELSYAIIANQTLSGDRITMSDWVLWNSGDISEYRKECYKWLKLHLQEVSTPRM